MIQASQYLRGLAEGSEGKSKISQSKQLDDPDMVTMSIGGNDVGFVDLLDGV